MNNDLNSLYDKKTAFYESIRTGNMDMTRCNLVPLCSDEDTVFSKDALKNLKYHFAISVSMMTRFCIEGGMPSEEALSISDNLIILAEASESPEKIHELHDQAANEFCSAMHEMKFRGINSLQTINAIEYINTHIADRISLTSVADHLGITISYLSRIFKAATGEKISSYILKRKLDTALVMLKHTDMTVSEISYKLKFTSQSYFTKTFKKFMGISPREYRSGKYTISPEVIANIKSSIDITDEK